MAVTPPVDVAAPGWAHRLLDAFLTGHPLNFEKDRPPPDIEARLNAAYDEGTLRGVPLQEDPMPVFTIKAQDLLADDTIRAYFDLCVAAGLRSQADEVLAARTEIREWQTRNRDRMKLPDHHHRPVR